jgi:cytochrome P450
MAMVDRRAYIHYFIGSSLPFAPHLPLPVVIRYRRAERRLRAAIAAGLDTGRRAPEHPGFLTALANLRDEADRPLPEARLTDEALTLSVTGFETLADGLAWTLHLLATHPDVQDELVAEVDRVVGDGPPTPTHLGRLEFTGRILAEALRLYPPTWLFLRVPRTDETLPGGTAVAAGDKIYVCPWILGRDPRHFPEPHRFRPDRFTPEARSARPRVSYIPFGFGPRTCIGRHLANREGLLILARIAQRFRFRAAYRGSPRPRPGITLSPATPVPIRLVSRRPHPTA